MHLLASPMGCMGLWKVSACCALKAQLGLPRPSGPARAAYEWHVPHLAKVTKLGQLPSKTHSWLRCRGPALANLHSESQTWATTLYVNRHLPMVVASDSLAVLLGDSQPGRGRWALSACDGHTHSQWHAMMATACMTLKGLACQARLSCSGGWGGPGVAQRCFDLPPHQFSAAW